MRPRPRQLARTYLLVLAAAGALGIGGCRSHRSLEEIEAALGALEARSAQPTLPGDPLADGFERVRTLFAADAEGSALEVTTVALERGRFADYPLELDASRCYAFVGFGMPESFDVDLRLDGPDGLPIASDDAPDPFPAIPRFCPERDGTYNLRIIAARREGTVRVGGYRLSDPDANAAARAIAGLRRRYAPDARALGPVRRVDLREGDTEGAGVVLLPARCYALFATATAEGPDDIDLAVYDADGTRVIQDAGTDAEPVIARLCPAEGGAFRVEVAARVGDGAAYWQLFEVE